MANIDIAGRLHSVATGNTVAGANEVLDDEIGLKQNVINTGLRGDIEDLRTEDDGIKARLTVVEHLKDKAVGLFSSVESLEEKQPSPRLGEWALVGVESPFAVYVCETAGTWTDSGGTYDAGTIDLSDYATKEDFEEIEDLLDGGVEETEATGYTWTDDCVIKPDTGNAPTGSYSNYSATSFIPVNPTRATVVRIMHLYRKTDGVLTSCGLAFYDANKEYISGLKYGVDGTMETSQEMREIAYPIPAGAKYLRETCAKADKSSWYCYFGVVEEGLIDRVNEMQDDIAQNAQDIVAADAKAQTAIDMIEEQSDPSHVVYQHSTDPENPEASTTARHGAASYTPVFTEAKRFNALILKSVKASNAVTADWRVYQRANSNTSYDNQPGNHQIATDGTLLASGTVSLTDTKTDIKLVFPAVTCPADKQVIVYLLSATETISLGKPSTVYSDTHGTVYTTGTDWTAQWNVGYPSTYTCCAPVLLWESGRMTREDVEEIVEETIAAGELTPKVMLPDSIYALVGSEINLYNDNISLSEDKGLMSPINYLVEWNPSNSTSVRKLPRCVRIRPAAVGSFSLAIRMKDRNDRALDDKTVTVYGVAKNALQSAKNILMVGSSSCPNTAKEIYNIFNDTNRYTGTIPTMCGTLVTGGAHHEGRGGWKWSNYLNPSTAGVANPFWNSSESSIDITHYRTVTLGMTDPFDLVLFQLGLNDFIQHISTTPKTLEQYYNSMSGDVSNMNTLINYFLSDSPNCKIMLALPYICEDTGGLGGTMNAAYSSWELNKASYAMRLRYMEFVEAHPTYILAAGHQMADRYYGFAMEQVNISQRYAEQWPGDKGRESIPSDAIHIGTVGYRQYADGFAAAIIGTLGTVTSGGTVGYTEEPTYS